MPTPRTLPFEAEIEQILSSRKYRHLGIPAETVRDLLEKEHASGASPKEALKNAKHKLHNLMAPYLGDPDYPAAQAALQAAFAQPDPQAVRQVCWDLMSAHASTRERLPHLDGLYPQLWAVTGQPRVILDLACALHPLGLPWMGLPADAHYHAYDIHQPRVALLNQFLRLSGRPPLAELRDILLQPPDEPADVTFFLKEAHRFEQRERGCNRRMWTALCTRWLVVSLPASSLTGRHDLAEQQRKLVYSTIGELPWTVQEVQIGPEIFFCIHTQP